MSERKPSDFDVEDLKVHKIAPPEAERTRRHLPLASGGGVFGPYDPRALDVGAAPPDIDRAEGGTGEAQETVDAVTLEARVVEALKTVFDPEIPLNIYDLGLIYGIDVDGSEVGIRMTLTAPACPVAGMIVRDVADRVGATPGVSRSHVQLVWEPPWTKDRMSEDALLELGLL